MSDAKSLFEAIDVNHDGQISKEEFHDAVIDNFLLRRLLGCHGESDWAEVCDRIDTNHDGHIDWKEFNAAVSRMGIGLMHSGLVDHPEDEPESTAEVDFSDVPVETHFFMIEHSFTEALPASKWWAQVTAILADEKKNAKMLKDSADAGFFNHQFLPIGDGQSQITCIWESYSGDVKDMQAFIDGDLSPAQGLKNKVMPINPMGNIGLKPHFSDTLLLNSKWPRKVGQITKQWLSVVVGREVVSFTKKGLEKGVLSDACICDLVFDSSDSRTAKCDSLVLKYAKADDAVRLMSIPCYKKELLVYGELRDEVGLKIPEVYGTWQEDDLKDGYFCIAMENLCVKNDLLDQETGITPATMGELVDIVAKFNAKNYKNTELMSHSFLSGIQKPDAKSKPVFIPWFDSFFQAFRKDTKVHSRLQAALDRRSDLGLSATFNDDPTFMAMVDFMEGPTGLATVDKIYELWATRPMTLCHGDSRCENIFQSKTDGSFTFIDWQMISLAPPGTELMQLLAASMAGDKKDCSNYKLLPYLVDRYYAILVSNAPGIAADGYTLEMCRMDFALCIPILLFAFMGAFLPIIMAIPLDHYLWRIFSVGWYRFEALFKQVNSLKYLKEVEKTL